MMGAIGLVAKAKSRTATGRGGEVVAGKKGEKGRFVTLKSGRVIFIPATGGAKWADVRDKVLASQKKGVGRGVGLAEGAVEGGFGDPGAITKETDIGRGVTNPTLVEFANGDVGVHKYDKGVLDTYGNPKGEVLAYEISQAMGGLGDVPKTIAWWRERKGIVEAGTLQEYIHESWTWDGTIDRRAFERYALAPGMAVLDAILGNHDRHGSNILEDAYGQIYTIDNNGAFGFIYEGGQDYTPAYEAVADIFDTLEGLPGDNPGRFMYAMDGYKDALGRVEEFSRSPKFAEARNKVLAAFGGQTARRFEENVNYMAKLPGDPGWNKLMKRYDELDEESGGDYGHWGEWD